VYRALAVLVVAQGLDGQPPQGRPLFGEHDGDLPFGGAVNTGIGRLLLQSTGSHAATDHPMTDTPALRRRCRLILPILFLSWLACEITRRLAVRYLGDGQVHSYCGGLFRLEYSENSGAFLGLGSNLPPAVRFWLLTVALGAGLVCLLVYTFQISRASARGIAGLTLVCAGGLNNWLDRVLFGGYVTDFMNVGIGGLRSGIFNVADVLIDAGTILLLWDMYRSPERPAR